MQRSIEVSNREPSQDVNDENFSYESYLTEARWSSYYIQLTEVMRENPKSVLIVGVGDGLVPYYISRQGIMVRTMDIDERLSPDHLGSVVSPDIASNVEPADIVMCCQVLEHMPFDQFERALENLSALCKKKIIISLPDVRRLARIRIDLPVLGSFKIAIPLPYKPKEHKFNGEHYWEIGAKGYPN
jgi:2-polyprenyl-3-methyl-5-hydroxy-6-metoxy-1,4-benzoquinol methylase